MEQRLARKRAFAEFLEWRDEDDWSLADQIKDDMPLKQKGGVVLKTQCNRINVPISRVHHWNTEMWRQMLDRPAEYLPGFQDAIKDYGRTNPDLSAMFSEDTEVAVGLKGDFGERDVSPRGLNSSHLGKLVKVFGIVTKCSLVRPKLVKSVHYVPATDSYVTQQYRDVTALTGLPTGAHSTAQTAAAAWGLPFPAAAAAAELQAASRTGQAYAATGSEHPPGAAADTQGQEAGPGPTPAAAPAATEPCAAPSPLLHVPQCISEVFPCSTQYAPWHCLDPLPPSSPHTPLLHPPPPRRLLPHPHPRGRPHGHRVWALPLQGQPDDHAAGAAGDRAAGAAAAQRRGGWLEGHRGRHKGEKGYMCWQRKEGGDAWDHVGRG